MPIRFLLTLLLVAAALSGCGRRGPLEMPSTPDVSAAGQPIPSEVAGQAEPPAPGSDALVEFEAPGSGAGRQQQSPGAQEPAEAVPGDAPKRRFFLDALL